MSGILSSAASLVGSANAGISSALSGAQNLVPFANLGALFSAPADPGLGPWADRLQDASWRGVRFAVRSSNIAAGRRTALHEYPFRDSVYVEDLGSGTRSYTFSGFLIGDDVYDQRDAMLAQCDIAGPGTLIHPSLGTLQATCVRFSAGERADLGRVVELDLTFIDGRNNVLSPVLSAATQLVTALRQTAMYVKAGLDFVTRITVAVRSGSIASLAGSLAVGLFGSNVASLLSDARMIAGSVNGLQGAFGRYSGIGLTVAADPNATPRSLLLAQTAQAGAVATAVTTAQTAMATAPLTAAGPVSAMITAFAAAIASPGDQIRLLAAVSQTPVPVSTGFPVTALVMQSAAADLCQRASLAALASATAAYQPTSYDDAVTVRTQVCGLLSVAAIRAADVGDTATFLALRSLNSAVAADLTTRGAVLPQLITVTRPRPLPSLKLAYDLYGDASRADDLIARVDPRNPAFFPTTFKALAA